MWENWFAPRVLFLFVRDSLEALTALEDFHFSSASRYDEAALLVAELEYS